MTTNITVADRLAERLKTSELGTLLSEDDTYDLCKQAIELAFFKDRVSGESYNRTTKEPIVVEIARAAFLEAMSEKIKTVASDLAQSPEFTELMQKAVLNAVLANANAFGTTIVSQALMQGAGITLPLLGQAVQKAFTGQ